MREREIAARNAYPVRIVEIWSPERYQRRVGVERGNDIKERHE
jgi:hypothetical protein